MRNNKSKNNDSNYMMYHRKKILILAVGVVVAISLSTIAYIQAQPVGLGQLANSLTPITPQVTIVKEKLSTVNGVPIFQIAKNAKSDSLERTSDGVSKTIYKDGLAELTLSKGVMTNGQDVIAATITNMGSDRFYLKEFGLGGETESGIAPLEVTAIDSDYSPAVWGNHPKPSMTQVVILNPGESLTVHMEGKWTVSQINQPITKFGGGVLFYYDKGTPEYNNGFNWSIGISN